MSKSGSASKYLGKKVLQLLKDHPQGLGFDELCLEYTMKYSVMLSVPPEDVSIYRNLREFLSRIDGIYVANGANSDLTTYYQDPGSDSDSKSISSDCIGAKTNDDNGSADMDGSDQENLPQEDEGNSDSDDARDKNREEMEFQPHLNINAKEFVPVFTSPSVSASLPASVSTSASSFVVDRVKKIFRQYPDGMEINMLLVEYQRSVRRDLCLDLMDLFPGLVNIEDLLRKIEGLRVNFRTSPKLVKDVGSGFQAEYDQSIPIRGKVTKIKDFPPLDLAFYRWSGVDKIKSIFKTFKEGLTERTAHAIYGFAYKSHFKKDLLALFPSDPKETSGMILSRQNFIEVVTDRALPIYKYHVTVNLARAEEFLAKNAELIASRSMMQDPSKAAAAANVPSSIPAPPSLPLPTPPSLVLPNATTPVKAATQPTLDLSPTPPSASSQLKSLVKVGQPDRISSPFISPLTRAPNVTDKVRSLFEGDTNTSYTGFKLMSRYRILYGCDLFVDLKAHYQVEKSDLVSLLRRVEGIKIDQARSSNNSTYFMLDHAHAGNDWKATPKKPELFLSSNLVSTDSSVEGESMLTPPKTLQLPTHTSDLAGSSNKEKKGKPLNAVERVKDILLEFPQGITGEKVTTLYKQRYSDHLTTVLQDYFKMQKVKLKQLMNMIDGVVFDGTTVYYAPNKDHAKQKKEMTTSAVDYSLSTTQSPAVVPESKLVSNTARAVDKNMGSLGVPSKIIGPEVKAEKKESEAKVPPGLGFGSPSGSQPVTQVFKMDQVKATSKEEGSIYEGLFSNLQSKANSVEERASDYLTSDTHVDQLLQDIDPDPISSCITSSISELLPFSLFIDCHISHRNGQWVAKNHFLDLSSFQRYFVKLFEARDGDDERGQEKVGYLDIFGGGENSEQVYYSSDSDDEDCNGITGVVKTGDFGSLAILTYSKTRAVVMNLSALRRDVWSGMLVFFSEVFAYVLVHNGSSLAKAFLPTDDSLSEEDKLKIVDMQLIYEIVYDKYGPGIDDYYMLVVDSKDKLVSSKRSLEVTLSYETAYQKLKKESKEVLIDSAVLSMVNLRQALEISGVVFQCYEDCLKERLEKVWEMKHGSTSFTSFYMYLASLKDAVKDLYMSESGYKKNFIVFDLKGKKHRAELIGSLECEYDNSYSVYCNMNSLISLAPSWLVGEKLMKDCLEIQKYGTDIVLDQDQRPYWLSHFHKVKRRYLAALSKAERGQELRLGHKIMDKVVSKILWGVLTGELHRGHIMPPADGVTIRIGRALKGCCYMLSDVLLNSSYRGKNVLVLGMPGSGKTTMLREMARLLSSNSQVCIVDATKEIVGRNNVNTQNVTGNARHMTVGEADGQPRVILDCVKHHSPDVLVIDELSSESDVEAIIVAKRRGVRVIAGVQGDFRGLMQTEGLSSLIRGKKSSRDDRTKSDVSSPAPIFEIVVQLSKKKFGECCLILDVAGAVDAVISDKRVAAEARGRVLLKPDNELGDLDFPKKKSDAYSLPSSSEVGRQLAYFYPTEM